MFLRIDLRRSMALVAIHSLFHLCAFLALFHTSVSVWIRFLLALIIAASVLRSRLFATRVEALRFTEDSVFLIMRGRTVECILESECHCTEWLQVLKFREKMAEQQHGNANTSPRRFCVIIAPDSAGASNRRQLRVLLRWHHFSSTMLHH